MSEAEELVLIGTPETKKLLDCSGPTLEKMVQRGAFPRIRVGSRWKYDRSDVLKYVAQQMAKSKEFK